MAQKGYAGRIKNQGPQVVKGPNVQQGPQAKAKTRTGDDLRNGSKKG